LYVNKDKMTLSATVDASRSATAHWALSELSEHPVGASRSTTAHWAIEDDWLDLKVKTNHFRLLN